MMMKLCLDPEGESVNIYEKALAIERVLFVRKGI